MADFINPSNLTVELGSLVPTVDGDLIKEDLAYPKSWDSEVYKFFRSIDFMSGTLDGEGNMGLFMIHPSLLEKMNVNVSESVPKSVLCDVMAAMFVDTVAGNIPSLTQEICDYYTAEDIDEQSNKVFEFIGDSWFIVPSNIMLAIHANSNEKSSTFQYLVTKPTPFPLVPMELPSWIKGAGHAEELHLLFIMTHEQVSEEKLKTIDLNAMTGCRATSFSIGPILQSLGM